MIAQLNLNFAASIKRVATTVIFFTIIIVPGIAQAITIDFDDLVLVSDPEFPCFCDHPLTDEYLAQGLLIDGGFLAEYWDPTGPDVVSAPNYLLASHFLRFSFVGALPTFVEMYVSASAEDAIFLTAYGTDGFISQVQTSGYAGPENDTPYVPNQYVSFNSQVGITSIIVEGFYNLRADAMIDDLTYEYTSVPEPSSLTLFGLGLIGFVWRGSIARRTASGEHKRT